MSEDRLKINKQAITIRRISNGFIVQDHEETFYRTLHDYLSSYMDDIKDMDEIVRRHTGDFEFDFSFKLEVKK